MNDELNLPIKIKISISIIKMILRWKYPTHQFSIEQDWDEEFQELMNLLECAVTENQDEVNQLLELEELRLDILDIESS